MALVGSLSVFPLFGSEGEIDTHKEAGLGGHRSTPFVTFLFGRKGPTLPCRDF